jgi:hypothetical protein
VAYVRSKTIKGKTYRYLVKSVHEGKRVRQVFVSYIGNPPPASGRACQETVMPGAGPGVSAWPDFTPLMGADVRVRYVLILQQLGCSSVVFSLRAKHKHGDIQAWRDLKTGKVSITKVRLHRDASVQAMAHEVGHVLDYVLQNAHASGGSLDAGFLSHTEALRKLADYTCAHHETSSPDYVRRLKAKPATPTRQRKLRYLERYYETYVYRPEELFARLVAVSFTEPDKARALSPAAYAWLQETLDPHASIRSVFADVGLWPTSS